MPRRTLASVRALARGVAALAGALATLLVARAACADPPWTSRRMTLGQGELAGNVGFGFADDAAQDVTGVGLYFQVAYGITDRLEVLVRDGVRFGTYGQYARAEQYGRLYSTDGAVSPGPGPVSNPDLVVLWRFLNLGFLELGAEGEVGFPVEPKTNVAATAGLAVTLHYAPWLRFDTGFYTTLAFSLLRCSRRMSSRSSSGFRPASSRSGSVRSPRSRRPARRAPGRCLSASARVMP